MSEKGSRDEMETVVPEAITVPVTARLCYVDDSRTSAYVVRGLLQPLGYQVDHFSSAEPAFVALVQEDYDLLLTDLKVSANGMDGDDLIRTLRNSGHARISRLPIIVITGASDPQSLLDVYDAGANQVMRKPVDADELDGNIRRLLADTRPIERPASAATVVSLPTAHRLTPVTDPQPTSFTTTPPLDSDAETSSPNIATEPVKPVVETVLSAAVVPSDRVEPTMPTEFPVDKEGEEENAAASFVSPADVAQVPPLLKAEEEETPAETTPDSVEDSSGASNSESQSSTQKDDETLFVEPEMRAGQRGAGTESPSILQDMDQYALVVTERSSLLARSGIVSMLYSLLELVGLRSLIMRALIVGTALTLVIAGWNIYFNQGLPVETVFVESGEIFQSITVPGRLVSKQRVNVSPARAGRLVAINVQEGDRVTKGQVLAKLDDRELLSRLKRAKANLTSAREGISLAERTLKRLRKAHEKGAVARRFVEDAEVDLRAARANAGVTVEEVSSATLDFNDQKITAAFAGTVTTRYAEIGQWVGPSETLFTLVDESQREIEVRVDSADSVAIDVGQVVSVSSDAFPGLEWEESVVRLGAATDNNKNANSVKVYISLGQDAPSLRIGQQLDADIRTAWNPNTLKVPFEALISRNGQTMVAVLAEGRVRMKAVETGIEDFSMAEIKQGLNDGEMVILSKGLILQNGDRVHPARDAD